MAEARIINFMGKAKIAGYLSTALLLISIASFFINGIKFGLDFTGGTQVELSYSEPANLEQVRNLLQEEGYENYEVVFFGSDSDVLVRIQNPDGQDIDPAVASQTGTALARQLSERTGSPVQLQSSEYVGSVVGDELREQGGLGLLVAMIMVMIYIAMRFQFKFAVACVAAVAEDVILTLGFFSIMQYTFDLTVLAAIMAVLGYGLNDTIVISDRIRENFRVMRKSDTAELINISLTQTLNRTLMTSLTTLLVLVALLLLGGAALKGFSIALIVGVAISIYSSLFVATNVLMRMKLSKEDLMPPVREGEAADELP